MDPAIVELSKKYNHDKKICRKCYATLPPRAEKCRKRACGHWPDIRFRKTIKGAGK
jgi:ribosomal protein L40E